eukprot:9244571-Pyramimonas_sp.AAC.1
MAVFRHVRFTMPCIVASCSYARPPPPRHAAAGGRGLPLAPGPCAVGAPSPRGAPAPRSEERRAYS